jgi:hypothetical protein
MCRTEEERAEHLAQEVVRLRRRIAELASFLAATEERVAATLEKVAQRRPPPAAERLRAQADEARRYAAVGRDRSMKYSMHGSDDDRAGELDRDRTGRDKLPPPPGSRLWPPPNPP